MNNQQKEYLLISQSCATAFTLLRTAVLEWFQITPRTAVSPSGTYFANGFARLTLTEITNAPLMLSTAEADGKGSAGG